MEWGPRALGNRSIVCDPRRADMKAILNAKIKRRESLPAFRALGARRSGRRLVRGGRRRPLHDAGLPDPRGQAAADPGGHPCRRLGAAADRHRATPTRAITRLIEASGDLPACRWCSTPRSTRTSRSSAPAEALDCFLRTGMDMLVLGDTVVCATPALLRRRVALASHRDRHRPVHADPTGAGRRGGEGACRARGRSYRDACGIA